MDPLSALGYVAIFIVIAVGLYYLGTRSARKLEEAFPGLPGPKPWPFIGHMPDILRIKGQLHLFFEEQFKKHGRLFSMSFGGSPALVVLDPEMIKDILVKRFECFHDRSNTFNLPKPLDKALTIVPGEDWKRIRSALSPSFSAHKLKGMTSLINLACDRLIRKVEQAAESKQSFDIIRFQQAVTMDSIMSAAFGIQTDFQDNPDDPVLQTAIRSMKPNAILQFLANALIPLLPYGQDFLVSEIGKKIFFNDLLKMADIAKDVVEVRRNGEVRKDLLDLMLNATSEEAGNKKLVDDEVIAQSVTFLIAGYETSSNTIAMTCYNLATNPDVQERLQKEIDSVWTDEDTMPSYETVHELPYLDMVIAETLRLCPPAFFLMRACTKECIIKGLRIPKDSAIVIPAYSIHKDPEFYPDPERFDPERFNAVNKESRDPYAYLPFGQGPHNCIGMRFALMEMKLVLTRLLKRFSFVVTPETKPPVFEVKVTLCPKGDVILGVRKR